MVEPLTAIILNPFAFSRFSVGRSSSIQSAVRMVLPYTRPRLGPDFFTPHARPAKGKGRAVELEEHDCRHCEQTRFAQGIDNFCAMKHSLWCPRRNRLFMMKEVIPCRARTLRRNSTIPNHATRRYSSTSQSPSHRTHTGQKRHTSSASSAAVVSKPRPDNSHTSMRQFLLSINVPLDQFDLETAWDAYESLVECQGEDSLKLQEILAFADKVAAKAEGLYHSGTDAEILRGWAYRLQKLLEGLDPRIARPSLHDHWRRCLLARVMALTGDVLQATSIVHGLEEIPLDFAEKGAVLQVYESIVQSTLRHLDAIHALDFLVAEWGSIGSFLSSRYTQWYHPEVLRHGRSLRRTSYAILESIERPATVLADRRNWDEQRRMRVGELLIAALCDRNLPEDAFAVLQEMRKQTLPVPTDLQLSIVRVLVRADSFERANTLYASLTDGLSRSESRHKYHLSTGLFLFAHQGDLTRAEEHFNILEQRGWVSTPDVAMLLHAYAVLGKTEQVVSLFHGFFSKPTHDAGSQMSPTIVHYSIVIYAHAQRGDFDGMNVWLGNMAKAGIAPDIYVYTTILKSFAMRGEVESVSAVLDQMRAAHIQPNLVSYTVVISLLARRKDAVAAEELYKRAIREGIVPDRRLITSLMNAHVEAGSWKGVIRTFNYLRSSPARHIRLSIEVYNTLLKAYVLIGAPFRVVSNIFSKLEDVNVRPDAHTFSLLIQSACDAGLMDVATDIFMAMEKLADRQHSNLHIDAYILTIMMSGFLRLGDKMRAKAVYDDMRKRNIQPTSVTFAVILRTYGNEKTEESLKIAEEFLKGLVGVEPSEREWLRSGSGRASGLQTVYSPLMAVYARQRKPEDVERLFRDMLDEGGEPTLGVLTVLLDVYRRTQNIEAVTQLWPQIFQLGLRDARVDTLFEGQENNIHPPRRHWANLLCIPLSIYIDALSAAGRHLDIAVVWKQLSAHGFAFDSHNWNHLTVALVRAGEPERAFETIERVVLPYQLQSEYISALREQKPDTPLTFDLDSLPLNEESFSRDAFVPDDEFFLHEGSSEPVSVVRMHGAATRATAVKHATRKSGSSLDFCEGYPGDFTHPLHILYQISPAWNTWRPHVITLRLLSHVLAHLEAGLTIQAVGFDEAPSLAEDPERRTAMRRLASDTLGRISENFPNTVGVVRRFERMRHRRKQHRQYSR